jgi:hypothetical protein
MMMFLVALGIWMVLLICIVLIIVIRLHEKIEILLKVNKGGN